MKKKGFTLIEVMIALAIIGVLVIQIANTYMTYIAESKATQIVGDLNTLAKRLKIYKGKKGAYPPSGNFSSEVLKDVPSAIWNSTPYGFSGSYSWDGESIILTRDTSMRESEIIIKYLDEVMDDGDSSTGKMFMIGSDFHYSL